MVAKKTTETPQWGSKPPENQTFSGDPPFDPGDIPEFLKRDKDEAQTDLETAIAETKPETTAPPRADGGARIVTHHENIAEPPHDPEETEEVPHAEDGMTWGEAAAQGSDGRPLSSELTEPQQYVPAPEPGSPEETEEVPGPTPSEETRQVEAMGGAADPVQHDAEITAAARGGDGRELSSDDNEKPRHVFDEMAGGTVAGDQLRSFVERVERLNEDKQAIADDIKEVYAEMKATGFDTGTVRKIVQLRKMDSAQRQESEAMLDVYKTALGMA